MHVVISVAEAIHIIKRETGSLSSERVDLPDTYGRVLAEDVVADSDLPPFDRARMDGYAVRAADTTFAPLQLRIAGEASAGRGWQQEMQAGEAVRIMTGAPLPKGADSVQQVEVTREVDGGELVEIARSTKTGQFITLQASEVRKGTTVLRKGEVVNAAMMAALASFGYAKVAVSSRPRVAVLATGSELVPVAEKPSVDHIRDSNTYSLSAYASLTGSTVERLPIAGDDLRPLKLTIAEAADRSDVLILSGGVSMGVYDFTKTALRELNAQIFFERLSLRPGKPTVFARLGSTLVFGLPGNPVSVAVTFNLFARTALWEMQGAINSEMIENYGVLAHSIKGSRERESYLPSDLYTNKEGQFIAEPLKWGGSSDFVAFARATALINVPEGIASVDKGEVVRVLRLPG